MNPHRPPAVVESVLAWALRRHPCGDGMLGDLAEEFAADCRIGNTYARSRYAKKAASMLAGFAVRRLCDRLRRTRRLPLAPPPKTVSPMHTLLQDIRYALRFVRRRPQLAAVVIVTMGLGLGSNAAIFALVDALVLRPFSLPNLDRLTLLAETAPDERDRRETVSPANFLDWRRETRAFEELAAFLWSDVNLMGRDEPERVPAFRVSANFFTALGVRPALGRGLLTEDERIGSHHRIVLSDGLWVRRFGGDPKVVGQSVLLDGVPHEIVGVMPKGFDFPMGAQVWSPLALTPAEAAHRSRQYLTVLGLLAPGRTVDDAHAEMAVIADRLRREHPEANRDRGVRVYTLAHGMLDIGLGPMLTMWQAAGAFVLLIACANVANLLLARGIERQRELAVRLALGAGRMRIARQMLVESTLLGLASVPLALVVAWASVHVMRVNLPSRLTRFVAGWDAIAVDWRLTLWTAAIAVGSAMIFGLVPALQASRPEMAESLKDAARGSSTGPGRHRLRMGLVVAQIALALPLLLATSLGVLATWTFINGPQGYDPDGVLTMRVSLPDSRYGSPDEKRRVAESLTREMAAVPGVQSVAIANVLPASDTNWSRRVHVEGRPDVPVERLPLADYRTVTPEFFGTLRIPIRSGRGFGEADREGTAPVVIVSASFAERHWPGRDPIGRRMRLGIDGPWLSVVGVAGDHIHNWFSRRDHPTVYVPFAQAPTGSLAIAARTAVDPDSLARDARLAIWRVDATQPVYLLMALRTALYEKTIGLRYVAGIMGAFAALALVLASVGIYALMSFLVSQRTHEIGIRMALGAAPGDVTRLTVRQAGMLTGLGLLVGLVLSLALARLIQAGLWGLVSTDARLLAGLSALLVVAAMGASYLPARKAAGLDPLSALRTD